MNSSTAKLVLPLLAALAAGCTTMGTGSGSTVTGANPINLNWKSSDSVSGTMSAALASGQTYSGQFFQITRETTVDGVGALWSGWYPGWGRRGGWDYWDASPTPDFITHYTGRVVANLAAPSGEHMRCKFQLAHPSDGMAGGGSGQCQMPSGETIDATFPAA
jgi:hypothetical protein